ncbi:ferric-chelate reductase 1 [Brachionus plicatilis]|uniref:Ferric-chelate reductase 1 n=1 Tax=Brachionus plicatilis TaxID=10195 RepID=A0A3M7Q6U2_BRAPC|nr:ferric-chelate reductase 1 [Brachionus plicatilis]
MKSAHYFCILVTIVILVKKHTDAYSYMVPEESCINIYPVHNATRQLSNPPFQIVVNKNIFHPNEIIKVSLIGIDNFKFMGFVLQARIYQTKTIVGSWNLDRPGHEFIGILKCFGENNSLVHAWPEFYKQNNFFTNVTALWVAPKTDNFHIEFVATVVHKFDRFWTGIKSTRLSPNKVLMPNRSNINNFGRIYVVLKFYFVIKAFVSKLIESY